MLENVVTYFKYSLKLLIDLKSIWIVRNIMFFFFNVSRCVCDRIRNMLSDLCIYWFEFHLKILKRFIRLLILIDSHYLHIILTKIELQRNKFVFFSSMLTYRKKNQDFKSIFNMIFHGLRIRYLGV